MFMVVPRGMVKLEISRGTPSLSVEFMLAGRAAALKQVEKAIKSGWLMIFRKEKMEMRPTHFNAGKYTMQTCVSGSCTVAVLSAGRPLP